MPVLAPMPPVRKGGYPHLGPLAEALGAPHLGWPELHLDIDRVRVVVSLRVSSGNVEGLEIEVFAGPYPRAMLRPETNLERSAKRSGISRELQLGDPTFDSRVYVDSDAADETLRAMFEEAEVRGAVVALLDAGCTEIGFSARGIALRLPCGSEAEAPELEPARLRAVVENARAVAAAPRLEDPAVAQGRRGRLLAIALLGIVSLAGIGSYLAGLALYEPRSAWLVLIGAGAGAALCAALFWPLLRLALRGRSSSHAAVLGARVWSFVACLFLGGGGAALVNGAFGGNVRDVRGHIVSVGDREGDDNERDVGVAWEDGARTTESMRDEEGALRPGGEVTMRVGDGLLGVRWQVVHAKVVPP